VNKCYIRLKVLSVTCTMTDSAQMRGLPYQSLLLPARCRHSDSLKLYWGSAVFMQKQYCTEVLVLMIGRHLLASLGVKQHCNLSEVEAPTCSYSFSHIRPTWYLPEVPPWAPAVRARACA